MSEENLPNNEDAKTYTQEELDKIVADKIEAARVEIEKPLKEKLNEFRDTNVSLMKQKEQEEAERKKQELIEAGKFKEFEENLLSSFEQRKQEELKPILEREQKLNDLLLGTKKESLLNELLQSFDDKQKDTAKLILKQMVATEFSEDLNDINQVFKSVDGQVVATNTNDFINYLQKQPAFQAMLKGIDLKGGGAAEGNRSGASKNVDVETAKQKKDLNGFLNAKFKESLMKGN